MVGFDSCLLNWLFVHYKQKLVDYCCLAYFVDNRESVPLIFGRRASISSATKEQKGPTFGDKASTPLQVSLAFSVSLRFFFDFSLKAIEKAAHVLYFAFGVSWSTCLSRHVSIRHFRWWPSRHSIWLDIPSSRFPNINACALAWSCARQFLPFVEMNLSFLFWLLVYMHILRGSISISDILMSWSFRIHVLCSWSLVDLDVFEYPWWYFGRCIGIYFARRRGRLGLWFVFHVTLQSKNNKNLQNQLTNNIQKSSRKLWNIWTSSAIVNKFVSFKSISQSSKFDERFLTYPLLSKDSV